MSTIPAHDAFAPISENAALVAWLRALVRDRGRITFRDFMQAALYHPALGYYHTRTAAMTRDGDYVTSPEVHPAFGAIVAKQIWEIWDVMGRPAAFDVVELGGATGTLARAILDWARNEPEFSRAVRYRIIEGADTAGAVGPPHADGGDIEWLAELPGGIAGCALSNEFFDALPVHRVKREGARLLEVYVTATDDGRFVEALDEPSTPAIARYFDEINLLPGDECFAEVNLEAVRWIAEISRRIDGGFVLTFDYGDDATTVFAPWRRDGTLRCFYRQSMSGDPYQRIGMQDMTSSVDFTSLRNAGDAAGLHTLGFTDQSRFLIALGLADGVASVAGERPAEMEEYFARRNVVLDLIDPARLGRIKVLVQGKGIEASQLTGFTDA